MKTDLKPSPPIHQNGQNAPSPHRPVNGTAKPAIAVKPEGPMTYVVQKGADSLPHWISGNSR